MATSIGELKGYITLDDKFSGKLDAAGKKMKSMGSALLPLSAAFGAVGIASLKFATDLNASMANVATLIPDNIERVNALKEEVQDLAVTMGKGTDDISGGLYQVISAYGDLDESTGKAGETMKVLEINAEAAAAGLATTTDAINLTSAVTKAYNTVSAEGTQKAADLAFMTVKLGQTTFPELAGSMGRVLPIASALGVSQEELFAGFATLTGVIGDAAETSTGLRATMSALLKPTEAMRNAMAELEITSIEAKIAQDGFVETIRDLVGTTDASIESVASLFAGLRAQPAVLALINGQAETFNDKFGQMADVTNAASTAMRQQAEGVNKAGFEFKQMKQELIVVAQKFGDELIPIMTDFGRAMIPVIEGLAEAVEMFAKLPSPVKNFVVALGIAVTAAGPFLWVLGSMTQGVGLLAASMGMKGVGLIGAFGSLALAVGVGWLTYEFITWLRESYPWVEKLTDGMANLVMEITGTNRALEGMNKEAAKSKEWMDQRTAALNKENEAWIKGTDARAKAAEASEKAFAPFQKLTDMVQKGTEILKKNAVSRNLANEAKARAFALSKEGIIAAVKDKEAQEMFAQVLELTGQTITDVAKARKILAIAEYNSAEATEARVEEAMKKEQEALKKQLKAWEERDEAFDKAYLAAQKLADGLGLLTQAQSKNARSAAQMSYELGNNMAMAAVNAGRSIESITVSLKGMGIEGTDLETIIKRVEAELEKLRKTAGDRTFGTRMLGGITTAMKKLPNVIMGAVQGGGDVWEAIGTSIGADLGSALGEEVGEKLGEALGEALGEELGQSLGETIGSIFGPIGSLLGKYIGKGISSLVNKEEMKVNDLRDAFLEMNGGWEQLAATLREITNEDLVAQIFDAETVNEFNAAVDEVNRMLGLQSEAQDKLQRAMDKYGITIDQLGPKFRQQELDKQAVQLLEEWMLLIAAGVDINVLIDKMGPAMLEFLQMAITTGSTVPEAMRPIVEELIRQGLLLDENGDAFENVEDTGIEFAESMTDAIKSLIEHIQDLVDALLGVATLDLPPINIPINYDYPNGPVGGGSSGTYEPPDAHAQGDIITSPQMGLVGEKGPEAIIPLSQLGGEQISAQQILESMGDLVDDQRRMVTQAIRDALLQAK